MNGQLIGSCIDSKSRRIAVAGTKQHSEGHGWYYIVVKNFEKNVSRKERAENMETLEKVWVLYDEIFCDELSIKLLYQNKDLINEFVDENENPISKSVVADWIMNNYYNDRKFMEYCNERRGKIPETAKQLYQLNEEYRKSVDEERLYLLCLIGMPVTKVANSFGVSRQTVYSRIKNFEENRLQEFLQDGRVA